MSKRLKEKYPEEMTVVLQHRFWDLIVTEERFEVKLTFDGIPERLVVPFAAIKVFFDPSVPYGLQFEEAERRRCGHAPARRTARRDPARRCRRRRAAQVAHIAEGGACGEEAARVPPAAAREERGASPPAADKAPAKLPVGQGHRARPAGRSQGRQHRRLPQEVTVVMPGLVPGIQLSADVGASGRMDPGDERRDDKVRDRTMSSGAIERLASLANGDTWLVHRGRFLDIDVPAGGRRHAPTSCASIAAASRAVDKGPFVQPRWTFALRASQEAWDDLLAAAAAARRATT